MANIAITQLPTAQTLTGSESVPVVQNGVTVQTTTGAIANSPVLTQTFLTVGAQPSLANSRYIGVGAGMTTVDGGSASQFSINLVGAPLSLVASPVGFQVKTAVNTLTSRSFAVGNGLAVTNPDGVAGNPTISYTGLISNISAVTGTGLLAVAGGATATPVSIIGTASQTTVANGDGVGSPTIGLASNPVLPGAAGVVVPIGTNAQRATFPAVGTLRYNSQSLTFEGYTASGWGAIVAGAAVTLVNTGTGLTGGPITSSGTISLANTAVTPGTYGSATQVGRFTVNAQGQITAAADITITAASIGAVASVSGTANEIAATGTTNVALSLPSALTFTGKTVTGGAFDMAAATVGADTVTTNTASQTLTNKSISGSTNTLSAIPNTALSNSSVTFNGVIVALGASGTLTATATNALTIGTGLSGASYNGSTAVTIAIDSSVATLTGTQALTNKTLTSPIVNTPITIGGTIDNAIIGATIPAAATFTSAALTTGTVSTTPSSSTDIANKAYVDTIAAEGIHYHAPVYVESPDAAGNLNALYNQPGGAGVGVGATLTNNGAKAALTIDGVLMTTGKRVLVYNQINGFENGVYTVTTVGTPDPGGTNWVMTRAADADTYSVSSPNSLGKGDAFFVTAGDTGAGETYVCTTTGVIVFGTTNITFVQISASVPYLAGTGLNLNPATTFNISNTTVVAGLYGSASAVPVVTVNAQGQLTTVTNTNIAIANTAVSGLGTMSTQNASAVAITGGTINGGVINGTTIGATTATTVNATVFTATGAGSAATNAGQVYLNGATNNRIDWNTEGVAAPTTVTRSAGTKLTLYPSLGASETDYAIGINAATLWSSVPVNSSSFYFKWYGAATEVASLDGAGNFIAVGDITTSAGTITAAKYTGISGGTF